MDGGGAEYDFFPFSFWSFVMRLFFVGGLRGLVVAVALAVVGGVAWGDDAGECSRLFFAVEYDAAFAHCERAAEGGDAEAQRILGAMYINGAGVSKDIGEGLRLLRLAAEQGEAVAQNNLGVMYLNGVGVSKDYGEAVRWFRLAAEQGNAGALFFLVRCMLMG